MAAALACFPLIGGLIFHIIEKRDDFVRYYAMQSIIFGIGWLLFNIISAILSAIFGAIPAIGGVLVFFWALIAMLVHIGFLVILVIAIIKALTSVRWDIPYIGPLARQQMGGTPAA